ncbi:MAG: tRNA lysidine(34) synthetase TilS [Christensenellaceae bacterium]|jgi:tRNA(Ile)-lysidine synthase|nr:tRNA lysidine(34) synthetase TilS [Christensenellaceae bacterium]
MLASLPLCKTCAQTIRARGLLQSGQSVLVGVSGGADSVALLRALHALQGELNIRVYAAHLNHAIRAQGAGADEAFVRSLCEALSLPLMVEHIDVRAHAAGKTLEQAARDIRYAFLERAREAAGASAIALAHHMEDQAESLLLHLARGSGLAGLCGMQYRRGNIIRPFLNLRRAEIEAFLAELNQPYQTDETNAERCAARNRLRLDVLPYLREHINPGIVPALCGACELLTEDEAYLLAAARSALAAAQTPAGYDRAALAALPRPIASRALRLCLQQAGVPADVERKHIALLLDFLQAPTGKVLHLPHVSVYIRNESICIGGPLPTAADFCVPFNLAGETRTPAGRFVAAPYAGPIEPDSRIAYLDADELPEGISARTRRAGDLFHPLGAPGGKKLKDVLIDRKIPRDARSMPLLCAGNRVLFAPGIGIAEQVKITNSTRHILRVRYIPN